MARKVTLSNAVAPTNAGATRMARLIASVSTGQIPAHVETLVSIYTPAPYVSAEITALNAVIFGELFPIGMHLKWTAWEASLAKHSLLSSFRDIPIGIQYGFLTGLERYTITQTFTPPNHYRTADHHSFVVAKYTKEISLGRMSCGYPRELLQRYIGPFRTAPLNVVQNTPGGKM